ncbi:MAG: M23 family metallopeptidase [Kosmotogaceae bacterium]
MKSFIMIVVLATAIVFTGMGYILQTHVVQPGDTLYDISKKYNVGISTLLDFNNIEDPRKIQVGEKIIYPQPDGLIYEVKKGDSITYIAKIFFCSTNDVLRANNLNYDSIIVPGQRIFIPFSVINKYQYIPSQVRFRWPVYGIISSHYGWRIHPITNQESFHSGLDIAVSEGAPIFAADAGEVSFTGLNGGYGYMVEVEHEDGTVTRYAHMSRIGVYEGQSLEMGSFIGRVGTTGFSTGPHLHFEIRNNDLRSVNPLSKMPAIDLMYVIGGYDEGNTDTGGK